MFEFGVVEVVKTNNKVSKYLSDGSLHRTAIFGALNEKTSFIAEIHLIIKKIFVKIGYMLILSI